MTRRMFNGGGRKFRKIHGFHKILKFSFREPTPAKGSRDSNPRPRINLVETQAIGFHGIESKLYTKEKQFCLHIYLYLFYLFEV